MARRRLVSPLTLRILAINILAMAALAGGLMYLDRYQRGLVATETEALRQQAEILARAIAEATTDTPLPNQEVRLNAEAVRLFVRRLGAAARQRMRVFLADGTLVADSRSLSGPGGVVQIEPLPPPGEAEEGTSLTGLLDRVYDTLFMRLDRNQDMPVYREAAIQHADQYPEVHRALRGEDATRLYADRGGLLVSVAVPIQAYRQVLGAMMLTIPGDDIDEKLRQVRLEILIVFGIAGTITALLSIYLAGTISRPIRLLAQAADRVRTAGQGRQVRIPDFGRRGDEIGDLSQALRAMTAALWQRMDAIEAFAADVSHEIKNPLTSLRSAVETAARVNDPAKQQRLMEVILDDVKRLDRLITDISAASRLDAELSRADPAPVDLGGLLVMLRDSLTAGDDPGRPAIELRVEGERALRVMGLEGRLVQVFQNLLANAISFSPPGGRIVVTLRREGREAVATVEDDGPGIPEGKLEAIFDRFYTERPPGEKFGTHSGLGLSISRQIVDAHGGRIRAENRRRPDGSIAGARFLVHLPLA